jgi:hypothetical protein
MRQQSRSGRPFNVREVEPASEAVRRLLLCIGQQGGQRVVAEWLDLAPNTLHQYLTGKRLPTLLIAIQIQRRSEGLILAEAWVDPPRGKWPPQDTGRAYAALRSRQGA